MLTSFGTAKWLTLLYGVCLLVAAGFELSEHRATVMEVLGYPTPVPPSTLATRTALVRKATAEAESASATATATALVAVATAQARQAAAQHASAEATRMAAEITRRRKEEDARKAREKQQAAEAAAKRQAQEEEEQRRRLTFFREDFSNIPVGEVPTGWLGTENVVTKLGDRNRRVLTTFQPGHVQLRIPDVRFPRDFRLRWIISGNSECLHAPEAYVQIGNLKAGLMQSYCDKYWAFINESNFHLGRRFISSSPTEIVLEKRGAVFHLLVNGRDVVLVRDPDFDSASTPLGFNLVLNAKESEYQAYVTLHLIEGIALTAGE